MDMHIYYLYNMNIAFDRLIVNIILILFDFCVYLLHLEHQTHHDENKKICT